MITGNKLFLNLTRHWFKCVENGSKTAEYRKLTPYWVKRINRVQKGDLVVFRLGYTRREIRRTITNIRVISGFDLPHDEWHYFGCPNEPKFFEIEFSKHEPYNAPPLM